MCVFEIERVEECFGLCDALAQAIANGELELALAIVERLNGVTADFDIGYSEPFYRMCLTKIRAFISDGSVRGAAKFVLILQWLLAVDIGDHSQAGSFLKNYSNQTKTA
jgi:hypothetical protein